MRRVVRQQHRIFLYYTYTHIVHLNTFVPCTRINIIIRDVLNIVILSRMSCSFGNNQFIRLQTTNRQQVRLVCWILMAMAGIAKKKAYKRLKDENKTGWWSCDSDILIVKNTQIIRIR